jgi:hypothetical protein
MNFIIWFAREHLLCGDLSDGELPRQTVSGSHGDADIPVSHYPEKFPVIPDDRQHSEVAYPQKLDGRTHISVRSTTQGRLIHDVSHFHIISPFRSPYAGNRAGSVPFGTIRMLHKSK